MSRPRVLVIAEAANPEWVSVPLVGWSLSRGLAGVAETHLVTQIRNKDAIERTGLVEGTDFTAIDSEAVARRAHKAANILRMGRGRGWTMTTALAALAYPHFERLVWQRFGSEIRAGHWDIVHRVTPLSPTASGPLASRVAAAGVPFVVGPLNGGVPWPAGFEGARWAEREWLSYIRGLYQLAPHRGRMLRATQAILVGSRHTESEVPTAHRKKCVYIPENAIDPDRFGAVSAQEETGPLRGIFVGRLVPYKGVDMAIAAAAPLLRDNRMVLDILGDGPMRAALEAQVAREGVGHAVTFHGNRPHAEVSTAMARANVLVFPSIREFGGGVVLEAMATGVVPIVIDYAGPGELVNAQTGFKIPIGRRTDIETGFRAALERLAADRASLKDIGAAAQARIAEKFTWQAKAEQIAEVYDWVRGLRADRPKPF